MIITALFLSAVLCVNKDYIVMFDRKPGPGGVRTNAGYETNAIEMQNFLRSGEKMGPRILNGYVVHMSEETAEDVRKHPDVKVVVEDSPVYISNFSSYDESEISRQPSAPWGLVKIGGSRSGRSYYYLKDSGKDVDIYILDTGVEVTHPEFDDRATWGANFVLGSPDKDENGHGTHCAGISGGKNFGVTRMSNIIAVKILDKRGAGSMSKLLQGIDFVVTEHEKKRNMIYRRMEGKDSGKNTSFLMANEIQMNMLTNSFFGARRALSPKSVVNLSVGGQKNAALNFAMEYASGLGIHFSTAAGNEHEDACGFSPGSSKVGITTGAATYRDTVAPFSNFGACVDVYAPGVDILSSWIGGTQKFVSGTSMATPHTTGVMSAYLTYDEYEPAALKHRVLKDANDIVSVENTDYLLALNFPFIFDNKKEGRLPMLSIRKLLKRISVIVRD